MRQKSLKKPKSNVAQPPPAVEPPGLHLGKPARPAAHVYHRNLPHIQGSGSPLYITFCTHRRWALSPAARGLVLGHCLHDHGTKIHLYCAVVMPDHVHMIYAPMLDDQDVQYPLEEVLGGIKGASAHNVNKLLHRRGPVWQSESLDHVLRSNESIEEKIEYIRHNPVRKGLCRRPEEYPWLWVNDEVYSLTGENGR